MSEEPVFVTGGTGFVGGRLVEALLSRGRPVRALARSASERPGDGAGLEWVTGDVLDRDSLRRGMAGCTEVFHLAAYAKNWAKDPSTFFRVNVEGARNVFETADQAGVRRVVYTSTVVVFGPTPPGIVGDEAMPRSTPRFFTEYEESKAVAEKEALERATRGLPVVIVHPTRLYGPGPLTEGNSVSLMIDQYDRGLFPALLDGGGDVGNYAFIDDVVQGHLLAMEKGRVGERYLLGGENVSLKGLFSIVDEVTNRKHFQVSLPRSLALLYAGLEKRKAEWLGFYPKVTPGWVETFLADWAFTSAKAEKELGYRITPLREGIRRTMDWLHGQRTRR
ncbi:MAG TPA: NAD-dependent epimerase/dehydratase family protein [Thermoanaerobaculia bacterium]|nr:NAD-dependent epimerase/dehydratase family protein [Thermoanaerobaculia bacterium]